MWIGFRSAVSWDLLFSHWSRVAGACRHRRPLLLTTFAANGSDSNNGTTNLPLAARAGNAELFRHVVLRTRLLPGRSVHLSRRRYLAFGNSSAVPYTGGTWDTQRNWVERLRHACTRVRRPDAFTIGVDHDLVHAELHWTRPILTGDNPTSTPSSQLCVPDTSLQMSRIRYVRPLVVQSYLRQFRTDGALRQRNSTEGTRAKFTSPTYGTGTGRSGSGCTS